MASYRADRAWSDVLIPQVKKIVGPYLLDEASFEHDAKYATDLMVFKARDMRIAARVRRPGYFEKYGQDFTIRSARDSGSETELSKIINGFGDWLFYGHADNDNNIQNWMIVDLHVFRAALITRHRHQIKMSEIPNGDGTHLLAVDVSSFLPTQKIVVASSFPIKGR